MERVSITRCPPATADAQIVSKTEEAIHALGDLGASLRNARKIAVKINAGISRVILTDGRQTELTEPAVAEGVLRALRSVTDAEIVIGDAPTSGDAPSIYAQLGYPERLAKYRGVRLLDFGEGELVEVDVPGQPHFARYTLHRELADADAFVSVAKMKAHASMGCTLCIKNLFGWTPPSVYGSPRHYLHDRLIRLPRVLVDLAALMRPCLNVVDGIVAANHSEWRGTPMRPGVLIAGANIVATDHVGARVMGFDPAGDYPDHPFFYRRNAIKLAAEAGLGPNDPEDIEIVGTQPEEVALEFTVQKHEGENRRDEEIRTGAATVARYREQQTALADRYAGRYLAIRDGELLWDGPDVAAMMRRERDNNMDWRTAPQLLILCRHPEQEIERLDAYRKEADRLPSSASTRALPGQASS